MFNVRTALSKNVFRVSATSLARVTIFVLSITVMFCFLDTSYNVLTAVTILGSSLA